MRFKFLKVADSPFFEVFGKILHIGTSRIALRHYRSRAPHGDPRSRGAGQVYLCDAEKRYDPRRQFRIKACSIEVLPTPRTPLHQGRYPVAIATLVMVT